MKITHTFPETYYNEETRPFVVDRQRKRFWIALLDLLAEFDRVCRAHNIEYSIDAGTMLGKVRHNGFIPWDDDIDVIIMRSEYEKLLKVADKEFKEPYFFQTMQSDPEAVRGHPQLRNSSMTAIMKDELKNGKAIYNSFNQGLFLDVFVLDGIPDDSDERTAYFSELTFLKGMMIRARNARRDRIIFGMSPRRVYHFIQTVWNKLLMLVIKFAVGVDPLAYYSEKFDRACKRYANRETYEVSHISFLTRPPANRIMAREKIKGIEDVEFEGLIVKMLRNTDYYLENHYGDWRRYVIGATMHSGVFFDLDNPYTKYF